MLSLNNGIKIARINDSTNKFVYIKENEKHAPAEVATTEIKKYEIFKDYIERDNKLTQKDMNLLLHAYKNKTDVPNTKLERKYENAKYFVNDSLKHFLDFGKGYTLHPYIDIKHQPTYRMFVSGLSGSGKSYFISQFLKENKPKHIFIMSPVKDDPAYSKLKPEPIYIDLMTYEEEYEKPFEIEDFMPNSVIILDDTDSDVHAKEYQTIKVQLLERGRHLLLSTIIVSHQALGGNLRYSKSQLLECEYFTIFSRSNRAHAQKLLERYVGTTPEQTKMILDMDSRAVVVKKSYPRYAIGEQSVMTLN